VQKYIFTKSRDTKQFWTVGSIRHMVEIYTARRKNPSINVKRRILEELRAEVILVVHWDRTHGVGIDTSLIRKSGRKVSG
jgi:hypothetical protein